MCVGSFKPVRLHPRRSLVGRDAALVDVPFGHVAAHAPVLGIALEKPDTHFDVVARLLRELKKQGYTKPVIGETVLTSQKVIELASDAANGAVAHVGLTADAPQATVKKFDEAYQREFKSRTDHNGLKGYIGIYTVKAVTEKIGKFDAKAFAAAMKNISLSAKTTPGLLLDVSYDANGDLDRESYMTKVVGGKQVVTDILPPVNKK